MSTTTETTTASMAVVALSESTGRLVTLDVALKQNGTEAWFTISCACGCDQGAVIVSLDQEAMWLAAGITEALERLSGPEHRRKSA